MKNSLTAVLQESHIPNEKIEDIINNSIIKGHIDGDQIIYPRINRKILPELINTLSGENLTKDLINKRLGNKDSYMINGQFNTTLFLMDASLVLDKMDVPKDLRKVFLDSAILRYIPQDVNRDTVKTIIDKYSKLYVALYQKQQENKRNVVDSKFVKISDTEFIEKKDNKIFFLNFDEKTGKFSEQIMQDADRRILLTKNIIDKFGGTVRRKNYSQYNLMCNEDFSIVTVNSKSYDVIPSIEKLGDSFFIDEVMRPVLDGIKNNRYVSILNDGEEPLKDANYTWIVPDTRSRVINYNLFLEELRNSLASIPKELREDIEKKAIASLISKTYLIKPENFEDIKKLQTYISRLSLKNITDENEVSKLYNYTEKLNQFRKKYVEEESQYTGIIFNSEDSKKRWTESLKSKEKQKEIAKLNQDINVFVAIDSMDCVMVPLEVKMDEEHYSTMEGIQYNKNQRAKYRTAAAGKVDYEIFCDKLRDASSKVDETKKGDFVKRVIQRSIDIWYGKGYGYPGENRILDDRWDLANELKEILTNKINGNTEVDMTRVCEIEKQFLALSEEEATICQEILEKRNPISFENDDVKKDYETAKAIHEVVSLPEETKNTIIQDLKDKSKNSLDKKRKMSAFAKLALSGKDIPSPEDVQKASKVINFYKDFDRE